MTTIGVQQCLAEVGSPGMAKHLRILLLLPLVLLAGCGVPTAKVQNSFTFGGRPIHPMSVEPLVGDLANEQPIIAAVDLEGSAQNASNRAAIKAEAGRITARDGDGFVEYRHIGTTRNGLHILVVMVDGGGSGVFEDVLWVKLVRDTVWEDGKKRDRTMLVRMGQFPLGDRDDGVVILNGAKLSIGKSRYRENDTIITLE